MWVRPLGREDPLEQGMATHSSILAWRIPWTEDPGGLQCIGLQRVGHDWSDLASTWFNALILYVVLIKWNHTLFFFAFYPSTPWISCGPWGHKELDMTERLNNTKLHLLITWCSILLMLHNIFNHFLYWLFSTFCYYKQCCNEQPIHTLVCLSVLYTCLSIE